MCSRLRLIKVADYWLNNSRFNGPMGEGLPCEHLHLHAPSAHTNKQTERERERKLPLPLRLAGQQSEKSIACY